MDIKVPEIEINYDYAIELLISGEAKDKVKDAIISILQVDTIDELKPNMSALASVATMDEMELLGAMSHLTEEEKKRILDVMKRAETLEQDASARSRQLTKDYTDSHHRVLSRQSSLDRNANPVCPICVDVEILPDLPTSSGPLTSGAIRQQACSECERIVCKDCGSYELSTKTKFQVWICTVCNKRKKVMLNSQFQNIQAQSRADSYHPSLTWLNPPNEYSHEYRYRMAEDRDSSLITETHHTPHEEEQLSSANASASVIQTPETPSRAQRPNFLQISDADFFGAAPLSQSSTSSSTSPGSKKPRGIVSNVISRLRDGAYISDYREPNTHDNLKMTEFESNPDTSVDTHDCGDDISHKGDDDISHTGDITQQRIQPPGYNESNVRQSTDFVPHIEGQQSSPFNSQYNQLERHQPLHRLHSTGHDNTRRQLSGIFDSHDGSIDGLPHHDRSPPHKHRDSYRHDVTNDYYLSEEEELAMIAHQSRHSSHHNQSNEHDRGSSSEDRGDYHTLEEEEEEEVDEEYEDHMIQGSRSYHPTHEWSPPVADLSPIEDVPLTMELEAEAEWLAYQRNGKMKRNNTGSTDSEADCLIPRMRPGSRGEKGSRVRALSAEIEDLVHHSSLDVVQEHSNEGNSSMPITGVGGLPDQVSEERDKDSQTSTVESGYESQSRDQSSTSTYIVRAAPPNPLPRPAQRREKEETIGRVKSIVSTFENPTLEPDITENKTEHLNPKTGLNFDRQLSFQDDPSVDYGTDFEDGVPVVAEGTTFNIHGGRDMFAKRSPVKTSEHGKPPIAKKPSVEKMRARSLQRQPTLDQSREVHSDGNKEKVQQSPVALVSTDVKSPAKSHNGRAQRPTLIELEKPLSDQSGTPTHISSQTGVTVKHREVQASSPPRIMLSSAPAVSPAASKPIPAPRRKQDNSIIANSAPNNNLEFDDEIVEIRFDDDSSTPMITRHHINNNKSVVGGSSGITGSASSTELGKSRRATRPLTTTRSNSVDTDTRTANLKRSMDELRKREKDENEITKDLEKQLAEIRRLEERQRNILQNTLRQVVHSVNENQGVQPASQTSKDEIPMDSRIDYSSLLSPSFNRKVPVASPVMTHRNSPQSPRKLSAGRRQDMQTINENGGYSITELAAMSPASSHRTLSSMASPKLPQKQPDYDAMRGFGSRSLPNRSDRQSQQAYHEMMTLGYMGGASADQNFRLSASYQELPPNAASADNMSEKNSGYFSDRETDRRRVGDELKNYTDEARRHLLQFEIEKRRKQVDENNQLRSELQRLIQSGSIPAAKYDKLRDMYREHINRSREYLGLSNSSLSSIATSRSSRFGGYEGGYNTDSDIMSSTEQLPGSISQSSTVERFMQSNDNLHKQSMISKIPYSCASSTQSLVYKSSTPTDTSQGKARHSSPCSEPTNGGTKTKKGDNMTAMPLLDIRAPKSGSRPNSTCELMKIGDISRTASDASFGDPEERIIDAKLEGGKTIVKSKEKEAALKQSAVVESMPASRFDFPTKQVLITPDSGAKEKGLGLHIKGGQPVPTHNGVIGAFVQEIRQGSVAAQLLGELKPGDEIVEWNGVCLRNKTDAMVQDIISRWGGEIEITVRLDKQPYKLPRHQKSDEEKEESRVDYEAQYHSTENVSGGFESPLSDKSWSKEFDESRQSTLKSRRGNSLKSPIREQHQAEINEELAARNAQLNNKGDSSTRSQTELRPEQLEKSLHDMSERLDNMDRQTQSPQDEFMQNQRTLSHPGSSTSTSEQDFQQPDHSSPFRKMCNQSNGRPQNSKTSLTPNGNGSVTRSTSDVTAAIQSDRNRQQMLDQPLQPNRRMSHQERLKQPPPLSPRTGRNPNMPRLRDCGELEAMLMYDYGRRLLVVRIERAVGLALPGKENLNPFIKVHFLKHNQIIEKRCTRYIEGTPNPKWEQAFTFGVEEDELNFHKIKMAAWDYFQPKQNMFIGTATIDLSRQQHVDGNLRMYKLDSDPGDRRDSAQGSTPFLPRNPIHNRERRVMSPPRVTQAESPHNSRAIPSTRSQHQSPQHIPRSNSRHASPHHSIHNSSHHSSPQRSMSSHRDISSEHSNSPYRELPPNYSNSSHSSRHSSLTHTGEDNYSQQEQLLQSPRHSIKSNHVDHRDTNGVGRREVEVNNNSSLKTLDSGDMRSRQHMSPHMSPHHNMRHYENY